MEKGNTKASSSKTNPSDPKLKQDVANKHLRLPKVKDSGSPRSDSRRKSNPQKNQEHFDKRPRNRNSANCERYRQEIAESESFSKRLCKKTSLNHLLNFTLAKNEDHWEGISHRSTFNRSKLPKYNKELFLQANCQFIARNNGDYKVHEKNPDILVEWSLIEEIRLPCHEVPLCPICLYVPVAAKITRCGHIYCWPCMLHYLALTDKSWQKCPICFEAVHKADLKSVSLQVRKCFSVGDEITMTLMKREKGTSLVTQVTHPKISQSICSVDNEDSITRFQKLLLACQKEVQCILNRERNELEEAYKKEKDTPESCFIESALKLLSEREANLNKSSNNGNIDLNEGLTEKDVNVPCRKYLTSTSSVDSNDGSLNLEINKNTLKFGSSPESNVASQNLSADSDNRSMCFFYQAEDGQHIYLHSLNVRMLLSEYGSLENAPQIITARIVEIERDSMTEGLRKRLRYLQHLPLTCEFQVVELDFGNQISKSTFLQFESEINKRRINRNRKARDERRREQMIEREENKKLGKYPKANYNLNSIHQFPAYNLEDFVDLSLPKPENNIERRISNEDVSNFNAPLNCAIQTNISEDAPVESSYASATSFAQMLKDGNKTFTSIPKEKPIKNPSCEPGSDTDSDGNNYVPVYNQSFSDAIQAALESVTLQNSPDNTTSSKKKKKGKKQLLFTTSMCRRNN